MMTTGHYDSPGDSHSYMMSPEMTAGLYDGTSSESSASSPINGNSGFESIYAPNGFMPYPAFQTHYPQHQEGFAPIGLIPVEIDIEGLYEDHDRRRRKNGSEKPVSSHVHSRRRAQNRASQRAFRDRKEKHMKDLETRLTELEGRHSELTKSYDTLQIEYSSVKEELDKLRKEQTKGHVGRIGGSESSSTPYWEEHSREGLDPVLFDVSAYCYDPDDSEESKP